MLHRVEYVHRKNHFTCTSLVLYKINLNYWTNMMRTQQNYQLNSSLLFEFKKVMRKKTRQFPTNRNFIFKSPDVVQNKLKSLYK